MAEEKPTVWLVVADGEGSGETRIVMGDDAMVDAILDMVEGHRGGQERVFWRDYVSDTDNWNLVYNGGNKKDRWRLVTDLGETGHLMIQRIDPQDMMNIV